MLDMDFSPVHCYSIRVIIGLSCYSSLRPVIVEPLEAGDEEEGNPENSMHKNDVYRNERKEGPR